MSFEVGSLNERRDSDILTKLQLLIYSTRSLRRPLLRSSRVAGGFSLTLNQPDPDPDRATIRCCSSGPSSDVLLVYLVDRAA